jgi:hypothetical protein
MYSLCSSALAFSLLILVPSPLLAQTPKPEELKSSVAALDAMHELITPMWHVAWPAKDVKALAAMVPDLEKHLAAIRKATLPGILQDKQPAWDEAVSALAATGDAYKKAAQVPDSVALLAAAEKLHMRYEKLVGLIRPALPEVDAFHQTLYVVYHYQLDPFSMSKIAAAATEMATKMDALNKAVLPERMKAKGPTFDAARSALGMAVTGLQREVATGDEKRVRVAVEDVHAKYELLEAVFK